MINQKFSDIKLTDEERELIEVKLDEYEQKVYDGDMPARTKVLFRESYARQIKEGVWSNRDYTEADAGEAPRGAQW